MTNKLQYHTIVVDGIDKTGKDTVNNYLYYLGKAKYLHHVRGIMSMIAYDKLYFRNTEYELSQHKYEVYIYLYADEDDWNIRCKMTNEPVINYNSNITVFEYAKNKLIQNDIIVLEYNTSCMTPIQIAKNILKEMEKLNGKN